MSDAPDPPHDYFAGPVAAAYDDDPDPRFGGPVLARTVDVLADLADERRVLELAVGTGRVALPLAARGLDVAGIELSPDMLAQLRAKPGGADLPVVLGDMTLATVPDRHPEGCGLVYLVFNTVANLLTQDAQVDCFRNAAEHLAPGGCFVVENGVPHLQRLPPGEVHRVFHHGEEHVGFDEYDVVSQRMYSHHYTFEGERYRRNSVPFRYVWPSELDLMARLAGMRLRHRWADWDRSPFTAESRSHVSVWEKAAEQPA